MCTPGLAACWFHRPWVRLKLPRNQSRDQYFPRLHRVTRGAHTLGTSMLCLWGCASRGCISLMCTVFKLKYFVNGHINYELVHFESGFSFFFFQFYFLLFYPIVSQNLCIGKVQGPASTNGHINYKLVHFESGFSFFFSILFHLILPDSVPKPLYW